MIVMKFGGSSVAGAERIRRVCDIVKKYADRKPVVVASAFRGATDDLLTLAQEARTGRLERLETLRKTHYQAADELGVARTLVDPCLAELADIIRGIALIREVTPRTLDLVAGYGERMSTRLIAAAFTRLGLPARQFDAPDIGLITDDRFGSATPLPEADAAICAALAGINEVPVVTGYIGRTRAGEFTTLGRNGSDYSAAIIGAALNCDEIQIWSDTDGIMTADPRMVASAKPIAALSFDEACELAYYGGKVLHPHTLVPAMRHNILVRVLNTFKPEHPGTSILSHLDGQAAGVKSIAFKRRQYVINVSSPRMASGAGFLSRIFGVFARHEINVDMIFTSEITVSVTTGRADNIEHAASELRDEFEVTVEDERAVICIVGDGLKHMPGVAADTFNAIKAQNVNVLMISQGASRNNIALVVADGDVPQTVSALHRAFFGA